MLTYEVHCSQNFTTKPRDVFENTETPNTSPVIKLTKKKVQISCANSVKTTFTTTFPVVV
jgi:hypothetical protein